ncbi:hypothetical protein SLEP1_g4527 [Rubroshorea leprosula]|uniref:Uncharacterized protein n=1 Tax=Rubroshorea leprosula TaxID=152421 RepID=A0AAV5HXV6_9ROSI|nr:hypothetical protein SLEP1_g4527 [Rubroshorea leprosula]
MVTKGHASGVKLTRYMFIRPQISSTFSIKRLAIIQDSLNYSVFLQGFHLVF